ncbi:hypothetical protein [Modestobacter sp. Leaf380]|uniref:hypothetical protein n=1 Tax=Modestobacter sp. Leaf380 TaxID=1736356 RepID=UPI0006FF23B0|nr:hypothetical protein [Modestobacter sp. Leaf380]KQS73689.1 hypothetical protein ASG41_03545 [Modestobacter sp. Leaf380]
MRGVAVLVTVALAGVLALAGCGAGEGPAAPASATAVPTLPPVPGVEGEVVRSRTDEALGGQVQVRLTDTGDEPFTVTAVALRSPGFAAQPLTQQTAVYRPGLTIDLPVPFGAVDCAAPVAPVAAEVVLSRAGGPVETVLVPLAGDVLDRVHEQGCRVQQLLTLVDVAVEGPVGSGEEVTASLVLTRVAGSPDVDVEVRALGRSVLLAPTVDDGLPATLRAGRDELVLPLTVELVSCEPHVLAETKKPFVFPLTVRVDGEDTVLDLPLDDAQRDGLQALVDRVC